MKKFVNPLVAEDLKGMTDCRTNAPPLLINGTSHTLIKNMHKPLQDVRHVHVCG